MKGNFQAKKFKPNRLVTAVIVVFIVVFGGFNHRVNEKDIVISLSKHADFQHSSVLLNNHLQTLPLKDLAYRKIASINTGLATASQFDAMLRNYDAVTSIDLKDFTPEKFNLFTSIIIQLNAQTVYDARVMDLIFDAIKSKEVIVVGFGNSTALQRLDELNIPIIWNPIESVASSNYAAQVVFGGKEIRGKLAENISAKYPAGAGYATQKTRLSYSIPEDVGVSSAKLDKIDEIVEEAIRVRATPSAVVLVVKDGNVIFNKAYGHHTYEDAEPSQVDDIYDLASVTKIAATTMAAMKLYEQQKIDLDAGIGTYLPDARFTNKNSIPLRDVMLHQAGLVNLDFFSNLRSTDHSSDSSFFYPVKIADNYYLRRNYYQDVMWPKMLSTPLPTRGKYVYSDLSMYVMKEVIEHQSRTSLDKYVSEQFYKPLGMRTAGYNPLKHFNKDKIVPTERDTYFRKTLLQGYVHDSGAALVDGVAGHAGLFASANDLAILNQMLLNGGTYGGVQYFKRETVELFTARQSGVSRRGLGFDRAENGGGYPSSLASPETFGHTGYTGTCVWVDPTQKLVYIFLSNRVYPSASTKLNSLRIRPRIQDAIYSAILDGNGTFAHSGH